MAIQSGTVQFGSKVIQSENYRPKRNKEQDPLHYLSTRPGIREEVARLKADGIIVYPNDQFAFYWHDGDVIRFEKKQSGQSPYPETYRSYAASVSGPDGFWRRVISTVQRTMQERKD